jgi:branched-chain amino acid transport system ATP-binding protein
MLMEVRGLRAGYDGVPVVWDVDLTVHSGEVVALLGANGAGKTTILLTIMGLLDTLGGSVTVDGTLITGKRTGELARSGLALVPDDRGLLPNLSVRDNLRLVRSPRRDPLELFPELVRLMGQPAGLLSGGEQQMLALARAFAAEPGVLLIDELSQGLAPVLVQRFMPQVRHAAEAWGAAVLLVEQDVTEALRVADRGYVLTHGRMAIADVPAAELLAERSMLQTAYLGQTHS